MKSGIAALAAALGATAIMAGCAAPPVVGELRNPTEAARVESAGPRYLSMSEVIAIGIPEVDGVAVATVRWNDAFVLSPGPHAARVVPFRMIMQGFREAAPRFMVFEAQPGHTYVVDGEPTESGWRIWMTDQASGEKVAELPSPDQPDLSWDPEPMPCGEYLSALEKAGSAGEGTVDHLKQTLAWREFSYMSRRWTQEAKQCDIFKGAGVEAFLARVSVHCRENTTATFGSAVEAVAKGACP